jgi:hypothetical protein
VGPVDLLAGPCITSFSCDQKSAETQCGVPTATGLVAPQRGAPYCRDKRTRKTCSCHLMICRAPAPLCPGTYQITVRQRLLSGCDGMPGQLGGTCKAGWNVLELLPQGQTLAERELLNTDLSWDFTAHTQVVTLTGTTPVRLVVDQYCWFADVAGVGDAGRMEVQAASMKSLDLMQQ